MQDSRTYTRLVCDKLLGLNGMGLLARKVVNLYYTIFSHPLNLLKFRGNIPINNSKEFGKISFKNENSISNILG